MFFITLLTTIINILASSPSTSFIDSIFIYFDRGVYNLVSSTFTLFIMMCQLNLNVIYSMADSLIARLKALVIVFLIFKVGVSLIKYMLDPDNAIKASKKLLINLLICAALLVTYNFAFSALNELSMMIVGKPATYHYTTLKQIAGVTDDADEGLIMRIFFASDSKVTSLDNTKSIGDNLAVNTLCASFPDKNSTGLTCSVLKTTISDGGKVNFKKLDNILSKVGKTCDAHPIIALIVGLYIVYSVIKAAIEVGTRMFKLMLLQLVAPLAIISVASEEGTKADPFKKFIKTYIEVFISAFTRIAAILIVTVFVSKIFGQLETIIGSVSSQTPSDYSLWILIICIFAGYKFAGEVPKMIDSIFSTKLGDSSDKGGFGKFLGSLVAMPALGVAGMVQGVRTGETGLSRIYGAGAGALSGMAAGLQGQTIADKFKAYRSGTEKVEKKQAGMDAADGNFADYFQGKVLEGKRWQDRQVKEYEKQSSGYDEISKQVEEYDKLRTAAIKDEVIQESDVDSTKFEYSVFKDQKFGDNKDAFVSKFLSGHKGYNQALAEYETAKKEGTGIAEASAKLRVAQNTAEKDLGDMYEYKRNHTDETEEATKVRTTLETNSEKLGHKIVINRTDVKSNIKDPSGALESARALSKQSAEDLKAFKDSNAYKANNPDSGKK